jgi:small subunit ribosomal protein S6
MAKEAPLYDLMLMLSTNAEDDQRAKVLADVEAAITSAGGTIERNDDWGRRAMVYEIAHQPEAEYHLLQFKAPATLIEELSHTLRITDGVLRFRVIKVRRGTPPAPSSPPPVLAAAAASGHSAPSGEQPAASVAAPAPSGEAPVPSGEAPAPSGEAPAPSGEAPAE